MPLNPEPLWPIVLGQHQDRPVPTWMQVLLGIVMLFAFVLTMLYGGRRGGGGGYSGDGGGGDGGGGGCGGGGDGG